MLVNVRITVESMEDRSKHHTVLMPLPVDLTRMRNNEALMDQVAREVVEAFGRAYMGLLRHKGGMSDSPGGTGRIDRTGKGTLD